MLGLGRFSSIFDRKAATLADPDPDLLALFVAPVSRSGITVTPSVAMRCAPVAAATGIISSTLANLPAKVYIRSDGGKEPDPKHPAYKLVHDDANDFTSAGALRAQLAADAMLHSNGYAYANRVNGRVIEFVWLDPTSMTILRRDDGAPVFRQKDGTKTRDYSFRDILHIPSPVGISYVSAAREAIALSLRLEMHAANLFGRGGRPSGLLSVKTNDVKRNRDILSLFNANYSGDSSGAVALLMGDSNFTPLTFSSVDAQFLECRVFQLREIARVWNTPVSMIGDLERSTNSNVEQQNLQFLSMTILPWLRIFTDAYRRVLFNESDRETHVIDFITDDLLRADAATRADSISKQRAAGVLTANEARALENRPPLPGGDELSNPFISTPTKEAVPNG